MKCSRFVAALMACVIVIGWFSLHSHQYTFSQVRKDSPADFNFFLNDCNTDELGAMMKALREGGEATPEAIRKAVVWRAYNKVTYMFREDKEIDYHEIVQWAAKKLGVDSLHVKNFSTYQLEKEVAEKYFAQLWKDLPPEERQKLIDNIVEDESDKSTRLQLGAYNILSSLNPEMLAGAGAAIVALGPVAWAALAAGGLYMAGAEDNTVSAFVMTVNIIKTRKYAR